jgi:hypothetical protein
MTDLAPVFPSFPALSGKKVSAAFDGGRISSDGGVLLLAQAEKRLGIAGRLAAHIPDDRDPARVRHLLPDILFARYLAIAAGYEDADDLDALRHDPAFKMALGRTPEAKLGLASQPTLSRWENAPDIRATIRLSYELIDIYCDSYAAPPAAVTLDIKPALGLDPGDSFDTAHGAQQLTFWNGFHGERGYAPIHVYEAETARPVAFVLRPAKTPSGREVAAHLRRLVRRIRAHWPRTRILLRGDGHYARPEAMAFCEAQAGVEYLFGLPVNAALRRDPVIATAADACAVLRAEKNLLAHRTHCETTYAAKSWGEAGRRVVARIEATTLGLDIRTIVTSLTGSTPERLYEFDYCARGQAENLIKLHKTQLKSDRTSCTSALANQVRLILHTAAYWLLWAVRSAIPGGAALRRAEFATLQRRLVKIGARVVETATRVRIAFASACPDKTLFVEVLRRLIDRSAARQQAP